MPKDIDLFGTSHMTVREISDALDVDVSTINKKIKLIFPGLVNHGKTTLLNEEQVTIVKRAIFDQNPNLGRVSEVKTSLEKELIIQQAMQFQAEKISLMERELSEMKPKADFYDRVTRGDDTIDLGEAAKVLNIPGMGRNNLFQFLREKGILMKSNVPYQEYLDRGYFKIVEVETGVGVKVKPVVYQKGLDYIRKKLGGDRD